ncbi:MAG: HEAT repeat domain-containing protein, partial [Acidobacteriota bacterium]
MREIVVASVFIIFAFVAAFPQAEADPIAVLKAEDARRFDADVEKFLTGKYPEKSVIRALLAAGRIGDERAIPSVERLLVQGSSNVKEMAAFALGEIESLKAADAVITALNDVQTPNAVRARLVEAAGKIAGANAGPPTVSAESRNPKVIDLGNAILDTLEAEEAKRQLQHKDTVILGLTAALRARPDGGDVVVAMFLTNLDARVRSDAANTLARLRAKNANLALRGMLI